MFRLQWQVNTKMKCGCTVCNRIFVESCIWCLTLFTTFVNKNFRLYLKHVYYYPII
jgi:hypothetical protein